MDRFLEKFNLLIPNQEEIEIMNKPNTNAEIETDKNMPKYKSQGLDGFKGEFYPTFKEELMSIFSETLPKICKGRNTSKLILQGHNHPDNKTRQRQYTQKRKLQSNVTDEHKMQKCSTKF